jgi:hypothetical protein
MTKPAMPRPITPKPRAPDHEVLEADVDHIKGVAFARVAEALRQLHAEHHAHALHAP